MRDDRVGVVIGGGGVRDRVGVVIDGSSGGSAPRHALAAAGASVPLQAPPHIHKVPAIEVLGQARACACGGARLVQGHGRERGTTAAAQLLVTTSCKGVTALCQTSARQHVV